MDRLIFHHIGNAHRGGNDLILRDFVRSFRGVSGTGKAKAGCGQFPGANGRSDVEANPKESIRRVAAMKEIARQPSPDVMGWIGEAHFRVLFTRWYGVRRLWYQKAQGDVAGIPFIFEVA